MKDITLEVSLKLMDINELKTYENFSNEITSDNVKYWKNNYPVLSEKITSVIKKILSDCEKAVKKENKVKAATEIYTFLLNNNHFLTYNDDFRKACMNKYNDEFKNDKSELAKSLIEIGEKVVQNIEKIEKLLL